MNPLTTKAQSASLVVLCIVLLCGKIQAQGLTPQASVKINSINSQEPPIQNGERFSGWLLKEQNRQSPPAETPYYLGTSWLSPSEVLAQEEEKQKLLAAFAKIAFPENDRSAERAKKVFAKLIEDLKPTGRVPLPNTNARYLEANPKLDPILQSNDQIIIPNTPSTMTVIRSDGTLCKIRYRPNIETRFYVNGCKSQSQSSERAADWAWLIQPDGSVHQIPLARWNAAKQVFPAPGAWIWAPPRWSSWTTANGKEFSTQFARLLAAQGPSGLATSLDAGSSSRGSLPNVSSQELYRVSRDLPISANIWGETGLLQTPSARTAPAGTGSITLGIFQPYGIVSLFFSPLDWVEFGLRYTNINNIP